MRPRSTPSTPSTPSSLGSRLPDIKTKQASIPTPPADTRSGAGSFKVVKVPNPDHKAGTTHRRSNTSGATSTGGATARPEKGRSPRRANAHAPPKTPDTNTGKGHGSPLPDRDPPKMVSAGSTGKPVGARTGCNTRITPKRYVEFSNPRTGKTVVIPNTPEEVKRAESVTGLRLVVSEMAKSKPTGSSKAEGGHSQGLTVQGGGTAGGSGSDSSRKRKSKKKKRSEHDLMRPATNPIQIDTDSDDPECRPPPKKKGKKVRESPPRAVTSEDDFFGRFIRPEGVAPAVDQSPADKKPPASEIEAGTPSATAERLKPYREARYSQDLPWVLRYRGKHHNDQEVSATGHYAFITSHSSRQGRLGPQLERREEHILKRISIGREEIRCRSRSRACNGFSIGQKEIPTGQQPVQITRYPLECCRPDVRLPGRKRCRETNTEGRPQRLQLKGHARARRIILE